MCPHMVVIRFRLLVLISANVSIHMGHEGPDSESTTGVATFSDFFSGDLLALDLVFVLELDALGTLMFRAVNTALCPVTASRDDDGGPPNPKASAR